LSDEGTNGTKHEKGEGEREEEQPGVWKTSKRSKNRHIGGGGRTFMKEDSGVGS
jgi:hypothetical protein